MTTQSRNLISPSGSPTSVKPLEELVRLSVGEPLEIDVAYCDLVPARDASFGGPFELRFRGTRQPDSTLVRFHVPLSEIEEGLLEAGAIHAAVDTNALPRGGIAGKPAMAAVPLLQWKLTLTKVKRGSGCRFDVAVRSGTPERDLKRYLRAIYDAAEKVAPELSTRGYAVGAVEIISIADTLFAARINRTEGGAR